MKKRALITAFLSVLFGVVHAQKGEKSITAGPLISFPLSHKGSSIRHTILHTGVGLEAIGSYNFTNRSALLLETAITSWSYKRTDTNFTPRRFTILSLQGGYRYHFGDSGFFINTLVGNDFELQNPFSSISFTFGGGKRFTLKDAYFIDAGIDLIGSNTQERLNIKAAFSLFQ